MRFSSDSRLCNLLKEPHRNTIKVQAVLLLLAHVLDNKKHFGFQFECVILTAFPLFHLPELSKEESALLFLFLRQKGLSSPSVLL